MAVEVSIPKLGASMTDGTLQEWLVADGDHVAAGQSLYILVTDKLDTEVESPAAGVINILVEPSENALAVGTVVAEIG